MANATITPTAPLLISPSIVTAHHDPVASPARDQLLASPRSCRLPHSLARPASPPVPSIFPLPSNSPSTQSPTTQVPSLTARTNPKGPLAAEKGSHGSDGTYKGDVGDTTGIKTDSTWEGVSDEKVDAARIEPMGSVKEGGDGANKKSNLVTQDTASANNLL